VPASGFAVHRLAETDSTNDWLTAAARDGAEDRTVVVADFQRQGKGRLGRRWEAPPSTALLCSVLLRAPLAADDRHLATVAVALSALDACERTAQRRPALKWPNDLVVGDRKLAGILAEADDPRGGAPWIVVGLGLNLTWPGPDPDVSTSLLAATGVAVDRDDFLDAYLVALDASEPALHTRVGRGELIERYAAELATLGRRVVASMHDASVEGVAVEVTAAGHLVVETPDGRRTITAGDVVHLRATPNGAEGRE